MKAVAQRPKDYEDIRTLVIKYQDLDTRRIERWVRDFAELLGTPDLWNKLKQILE